MEYIPEVDSEYGDADAETEEEPMLPADEAGPAFTTHVTKRARVDHAFRRLSTPHQDLPSAPEARAVADSLSATVVTSRAQGPEEILAGLRRGNVRDQSPSPPDVTVKLFASAADLLEMFPQAARRPVPETTSVTSVHNMRNNTRSQEKSARSLVTMTHSNRVISDGALAHMLNARNLARLSAVTTEHFVQFLINKALKTNSVLHNMRMGTRDFTVYRPSEGETVETFLRRVTENQQESIIPDSTNRCRVVLREHATLFMRRVDPGENPCMFGEYDECQCQLIARIQAFMLTGSHVTQFGFVGIRFPGFNICVLCLFNLGMQIYLDPHNATATNLYTVKPDYPGEFPSSALLSSRCTDTTRVGMMPVIAHHSTYYRYSDDNRRILCLIPMPSPNTSLGF